MLLHQHSQYPGYGISPVTTINEQIEENVVYEIVKFQSFVKKNEIIILFGENQCKGGHLVKCRKPDQKRQISQVSTHLRDLDLHSYKKAI